MKILIATIGTRGDVQPYIALGRALKESGHEITICTCAHFEPFVREYGLGYAYVNNDFIDFMHSPEGKIILGNAGNLWKTIATLAPIISKLGNPSMNPSWTLFLHLPDCLTVSPCKVVTAISFVPLNKISYP